LLNVGAQEDPLNSIKINTIGTANILEASRKLDVNKVIFISSATLYTNKREINEYGKLSEENVTRKTNIYITTKLACENIGINYSELYGLDFISLRPAGVFGPWLGKG